MIVFCAFDQDQMVIDYGKKYGFMHHYPIFFIKNYSAQALKANMKIVGATEHAIVLYRDKLPKFRNMGPDGKRHMVFDWFAWERDSRKEYPKIHPTQKPVALYSWIFRNYARSGDRILDTHLGSGSSRIAAYNAGLDFVGCEIDKDYFEAQEERWKAYTAQIRLGV